MKTDHPLTLYFDTSKAISNFMDWYLEGGGEKNSHYYAEDYGKNWIRMKRPDNACPHCDYWCEKFEQEVFRYCPSCGKKI